LALEPGRHASAQLLDALEADRAAARRIGAIRVLQPRTLVDAAIFVRHAPVDLHGALREREGWHGERTRDRPGQLSTLHSKSHVQVSISLGRSHTQSQRLRISLTAGRQCAEGGKAWAIAD